MDVNRPILRRSNNELGNVALFVAVVLPVALTFTILLIDVTAYHSHRALTQQRIDSIVAKATKLLPNTVAARTFINSELERFDSFAADKTARGGGIEVDSTGIGLRVAGSYKASFSGFLPRVDGEPLSFEYWQVSKSKIVPTNTVLVIADGNTLRPPAHTVWGNVQTWPPAEYWKFVNNPKPDYLSVLEEPIFWRDWNKEWDSEPFRRWATQHCFNPVLSSVKLAAIGLVDVLGARTDSRLGVVHTPGDGEGRGYSVTRPLIVPSQEAPGPEANWAGYFELESLTGDELCSFISSLAITGDWRYTLPNPLPGYGLPRGSKQSCKLPDMGINGYEHMPYKKVGPECLSVVSLREAIYWRSARQYSHEPGAANVYRAIDIAYLQITSPGGYAVDTEEEISAERGDTPSNSLDLAVKSNIIVLTDALPSPSEIQTQDLLQRLGKYGTRLTLIPISHEGLSDTAARELEQRAREYRSVPSDLANVSVYFASSPQELTSKIVPLVLSANKQVVITR